MKNLFTRIKEKKLWKDLVNVILGLAIVILLILFAVFPGNAAIIGLLFCAAGTMNLWTGLRQYSEAGKKGTAKNIRKRSAAMCFIMLGTVILALGVMVMRKLFV